SKISRRDKRQRASPSIKRWKRWSTRSAATDASRVPPDPATPNSIEEAADLLLDFAEALHGVQMSSDAVESQLLPIASRLGVTAELALLQSHITVELRGAHGRWIEMRRIDFDAHWRLARVEDLVALARAAAEGQYSPSEARSRLRAIVAQPQRYAQPAVIAAY